MSLITLNSVGVTLGAPLFSALDLTIHRGERIGLVAANGRGKSTLLRLVAGETQPDSGEMTLARNLRVALMPQVVPDALMPLPFRDAVLEALPAESRDWEEWRVDVALDDLQVPEDLRARPLSDLSGGWQRFALLARALMREPDVLLMDEPTNHLDLTRIAMLERWITAQGAGIASVIASHDRAFLDAVTNRTLFLRPDRSADYALPYDRARAALAEHDAAKARTHANDLREAAQLRRQAQKLKNIGVNSGSDLLLSKHKYLTDRAERIEEAAQPAHRERSAGQIRLAGADSHARTLLTLDNAEVRAPDGRLLFRTGQKWISPAERVILLGANGAGKSCLMTAIAGVAAGGTAGGIRLAGSALAGIVDQGLARITPDATPFGLLSARFRQGDVALRSLLSGAGITHDWQARPVAALSGGQRARLAILVLRLERPNFYLLDEPTNHLDIEGQEALEDELTQRETGCLIVSHDRSFVRNVGTRFWEVVKGSLQERDDPETFFAAA
ncbi:MAG TPA: ABC-F family ATP-binding cassette domain-containing protein [Albidovulum sp.]|uniref:ABC-F family ATP-binding cassette domain-containing protein n=1 Tax=Albidovulum sp. TaxID=1872424 RepID=UPI002CDF7C40|nr:ABC-F family ATP-binding cassette domain-containing protein [Albidovulum sp.]